MKKTFILLLALAMTFTGATMVMAKISGSPHDLSTTGASEICAFCHTPHGASKVEAPLWNRSQNSTTYTMYNSATFDMGNTSSATLAIGTAGCMVCHNGVASSLVNYPGPGSIATTDYANWVLGSASGYSSNYATWANLGTDLSNDHPVGFTYNASVDLDGNGFPTLNGNGWITGTSAGGSKSDRSHVVL